MPWLGTRVVLFLYYILHPTTPTLFAPQRRPSRVYADDAMIRVVTDLQTVPRRGVQSRPEIWKGHIKRFQGYRERHFAFFFYFLLSHVCKKFDAKPEL